MLDWHLGIQDAASPLIEEMIAFHDLAMQLLIFILTGVGCAILDLIINGYTDRYLLEGQTVECAWTLIPAIILVQLCIPSLLLLYILDESSTRSLSIKTVGHQWYWSYEYSDFWGYNAQPEFDSFVEKSNVSSNRLLDVDSRLVLPMIAQVRVLITSADVLHSWTIPRIGVKADACPGRLNQVNVFSHRPGVFFGQCSEICGANHSFMPIAVEFVRRKDFKRWINNY